MSWEPEAGRDESGVFSLGDMKKLDESWDDAGLDHPLDLLVCPVRDVAKGPASITATTHSWEREYIAV